MKASISSVRSMILWPLLVTLLVGFFVLSAYVSRSVRSDALDLVDSELARINDAAVPLGRPGTGPTSPPREAEQPTEQPLGAINRPILAIVDRGAIAEIRGNTDDRLRPRIAEADLLRLIDRDGIRSFGGSSEFRVLVKQRNNATIVSAIALDDVNAAVAGVRRSLFLGALGVFGIQALAVWFTARRIAKPIESVSAAAGQIADGDLDTPIPENKRPQETAELASSVAVMVTGLRNNIAAAEISATEATRARDQMRRFLADASHELRTPLTSIGGYAQLHNRGMLEGDSLTQAMERVESESARLSRLVDGMLLLARDGDLEPFTPGPVEVAPLLAGVAADLRAAYPGRTVTSEPNVGQTAERSGATVAGDADQLHQAVLNLGKNAIEHSPGDSPVTLSASTGAADQLVIEVIDHGTGIDPADAERVFEAFYRPDSSRQRSATQSGAGLGLAVTKMIADRHGASITHRPTTGGGTTFTLAFESPMAETVPAQP